MTFEELKPCIDELSEAERKRVRDYLDEHETLKAGTMNVDALLKAVDKIREGMSQEEIDEMGNAMNGKVK